MEEDEEDADSHTHAHARTHMSNPPTPDFPGSSSDASFQPRLNIVSPLFTIAEGMLRLLAPCSSMTDGNVNVLAESVLKGQVWSDERTLRCLSLEWTSVTRQEEKKKENQFHYRLIHLKFFSFYALQFSPRPAAPLKVRSRIRR